MMRIVVGLLLLWIMFAALALSYALPANADDRFCDVKPDRPGFLPPNPMPGKYQFHNGRRPKNLGVA